jgi:hypothetical protein
MNVASDLGYVVDLAKTQTSERRSGGGTSGVLDQSGNDGGEDGATESKKNESGSPSGGSGRGKGSQMIATGSGRGRGSSVFDKVSDSDTEEEVDKRPLQPGNMAFNQKTGEVVVRIPRDKEQDKGLPVLMPGAQNPNSSKDSKSKTHKSDSTSGGSEPGSERGKDPSKLDEKEQEDKGLTALVAEARKLDSANGGEMSGEASQAFVDFMAARLPKGSHFDMGCSTGLYLYNLSIARADLTLCGIDINRTRINLAKALFDKATLGIATQEIDILKMTEVPETVTSMFMHDTVWTDDVLEASTRLILENSSLEMVVCVKPRPKLEAEGSFKITERYQFSLRGGKKTTMASVYERTRSTNVQQVRMKVVEVARSCFDRDSEFYAGTTAAEKRANMEVRTLY